ncbi:hypothetical protein GCM10011487_02340 [Steroidobacter agaridevorans]|uniref:DUF4159 domain-containing protein n=2 Tax=Steroidobacter agaridevorans TaxID=2695856 RepID=A0A829Y4X3_9GAMM|nr:hypothetical protein GCM10011487_02340 [Steroidobacter agaridevorans]GFE91291.1 hypothetical protein GCM10011488_62450 [Steroidobacter agaridevorans]
MLATGAFATLGALAGSNLITGDGGRASAPADLSRLNLVRAIYDSEGGMGEAYYAYDGRVWARWETDFPEGDDNFGHRLKQLTRINVAPKAASRLLTAPDLGDFPMLYMSDPGYMVITEEERTAFANYLKRGGFVWVDDFWGDAEWQQFANVMRTVLPNREWRVLSLDHPIFHTVFDLKEMPQIPALPFASPGGSTAESPGAHKFPAGSLDTPQMRAWLDDDGRIMVLATHNTDVGDGWEREAYGEWYFETFSTRSYMVGVNVVVYAMTH